MGDLDIKGALSSITSEALLEAAILVVIASLLILVVQKL
ncbi:MAG TPA: mechanosensitive ion channel protein MscS, partial [Marinobacter sp.]|nr:mechanosensitive ion channel protein MscS [Marinobacter sp.]